MRHLQHTKYTLVVGGVLAVALGMLAFLEKHSAGRERRMALLSTTPSTERVRIRQGSLNCLTKDEIENIRKQPPKIMTSFERCRSELVADLGDEFSLLSDANLFGAFSSIVAYSMAPYGNSVATDLSALVRESKMDCDNYAILVGHFCELRSTSLNSQCQLHYIGWDGGQIGNHAQVFMNNPEENRSLLLDPTIALVALANFNSVASGKPIQASRMVDFSWRTDADIKDFGDKVVKALNSGLYKPSDLLYYFDKLEDLINPRVAPYYWMTPGAMSLRARASNDGTLNRIKDPLFARTPKK